MIQVHSVVADSDGALARILNALDGEVVSVIKDGDYSNLRTDVYGARYKVIVRVTETG